jgi:hypothetical protein
MSSYRALPSGAMRIALAAILFGPLLLVAQSSQPSPKLNSKAATTNKTAASGKTWAAPRNPYGQPDLHGYWTSESFTPLERPAKYQGREFLSDQEAAEVQKAGLQRGFDRTYDDPVEEPVYDSTTFGLTPALEGFAPNKRTSLIVDPPDGKLPPRTPEAMKRPRAVGDRDYIEADGHGGGVVHADTPRDLGVRTTCISMSGGPPIMPGAYNNGLYIHQSENYVVLQAEYGSELRIVPLDGRPHVSDKIRQWRGDGRGHWEGDTLVVETTNFRPEATFRNGNSRTMKITERFKRVAADQIEYSFTIDDPATWTKPWTAIVPLHSIKGPLFEYACSESNMDVVNIMAGERATEKAAAEKLKGSSNH